MKTVLVIGIFALLLTACVSNKDQKLGYAALKESPTVQAEFLDRCKKMPQDLDERNGMDQQVLIELNVPKARAKAVMCERIVAGFASGTIGPEDIDRWKQGMFTDAMFTALRTPETAPAKKLSKKY